MAIPSETDDTTVRAQSSDQRSSAEEVSSLELRVVHSADTRAVGRGVLLTPHGSAVLGRRVGLELSFDDERVSRSHLRVVWDQRVRVHRFADLGSANGTFLNGQPCDAGILSRNDLLRLGDTLLVCHEPALQAEFDERVLRAAGSQLPVLLLGETGAGKEVIARRIHAQSERSGPFVSVNCAALPRELAAAELFGHTRGAFSGAGSARDGLLRASSGGTLFLDEIGELPKDLQPALLRSLQERTVRAIGSDRETEVDLRVVSATNADLESMIERAEFREDLLARLAHIVLRIAPLRQRRVEILSLVAQFAPEFDCTTNAAENLVLYRWPRNVRQLRSLVEALHVLKPSGTRFHVADLLEHISALDSTAAVGTGPLVRETAAGDRCSQLATLLEKHSGNIAGVARELGKPRSHVYRWMRAFRLSRQQFES